MNFYWLPPPLDSKFSFKSREMWEIQPCRSSGENSSRKKEQNQNPEPWWTLEWAWCFWGIAGRTGSLGWKQLERKYVSRASQRFWDKRFCRSSEGLWAWVLLQYRALSRGAAWSAYTYVIYLMFYIYQFDMHLLRRSTRRYILI